MIWSHIIQKDRGTVRKLAQPFSLQHSATARRNYRTGNYCWLDPSLFFYHLLPSGLVFFIAHGLAEKCSVGFQLYIQFLLTSSWKNKLRPWSGVHLQFPGKVSVMKNATESLMSSCSGDLCLISPSISLHLWHCNDPGFPQHLVLT